MFDDRGNAFLADFDIAKAITDKARENQKTLTGTGMALGTPDHMAPELVLGKPYDGRADQYGLAAVLYELYSGEPVFSGTTPVAIMMKHASDAPEALRTRDGLIPTALSEAIDQGLAKQPNDRYENCRAFANSVLRANEAFLWARENRGSKDTLVTSLETSAIKLSPLRPPGKRPLSKLTHPPAWSVVAAVTCVLGLGTAGIVRYFRGDPMQDQSPTATSAILLNGENGTTNETPRLAGVAHNPAPESAPITAVVTSDAPTDQGLDATDISRSQEELDTRNRQRDMADLVTTPNASETEDALPSSASIPGIIGSEETGVVTSSPPSDTVSMKPEASPVESASPTSSPSEHAFDKEIEFPTVESVADVNLRSRVVKGRKLEAYCSSGGIYLVAQGNSLHALNVARRKRLGVIEFTDAVQQVAVARNGSTVAAADSRTIQILEVVGDRLRRHLGRHERGSSQLLEVSYDGKFVVYSTPSQLNIYNTATRKWTILPSAKLGNIDDFAISDNGVFIAALQNDFKVVALWEVKTKQLLGQFTTVTGDIVDDTLRFEADTRLTAEFSDGLRRDVIPVQ